MPNPLRLLMIFASLCLSLIAFGRQPGSHSTAAPPTIASLTISPAVTGGGSTSTGTITLTSAAPPGGLTISLSSNNSSATVHPTAVVGVSSTSTIFEIVTAPVTSSTTATITATLNGSSKTATLTINPLALASLTLTPSTLIGGASAQGGVYLNAPAPAGGLTVILSSSDINATIPGAVQIASGGISAGFTFSTSIVKALDTVVVTASIKGSSLTANLQIQPLVINYLSISPSTIVGGCDITAGGSLYFNGPTPYDGAVVTLTSSAPNIVSVPATLKTVSRESGLTFTLTHKMVTSPQTVTITASWNGNSKTTTLTVNPFQMIAFEVYPAEVIGGTGTSGIVGLNAYPSSATGPISIKLASNSKFAVVPAVATVAPGASTGSFAVTTTAVPSSTLATLTATFGTKSFTSNLFVQSPTVKSISVSPATVQGSSKIEVTGTVTLTGPAPTGGTTVTLASNNPAATVPTTVTIPAGKTSETFKVTHTKVTTQTQITLSASIPPAIPVITTLTLTP